MNERVTRSGRQTAVKSHSTLKMVCSSEKSISPDARLYSLVTGQAVEDWTYDGQFVIIRLGEKSVLALSLGGDSKANPGD